MLIMSIEINSIIILSNHGVDYHCIIVAVTNIEAINLIRNDDLSKNSNYSSFCIMY